MRGDVLGLERRRRWDDEEKLGIVLSVGADGATVTQVAQRRGNTPAELGISALKKGVLDAAGYAVMIDSTTRLNTPGPYLAVIGGVHAMTDVTGFGPSGTCAGNGAGCGVHVDWSAVPLLPRVRDLAGAGHITGASAKN